MSIYTSMRSYAQRIAEGQAKIEALNRNYWAQDAQERMSRDLAKVGEISARSYAAGALDALIYIHIENSPIDAPISDRLTQTDILTAVRLAQPPEDEPSYWEYIERGGVLCYATWMNYCQERAALYNTEEEELDSKGWARLHTLDLALLY